MITNQCLLPVWFFCAVLLLLPTAARAQFIYTVDNGEITITGYVGTDYNLTIPSSIDGLPVTRFEAYAFHDDGNLTSITVPASITNIAVGVFQNCSSLTNIILPDGIASLEMSAFYGCSGLTSITLPDGLVSIGADAFDECISLTSVTIPSGVNSIGQGAFAYCNSLTNITIPASVVDIGTGAFAYCNQLTAILVDVDNPNYCSDEGVLFDKSLTTLVEYAGGVSDAYVIPDGITCIGINAFYGCYNLTNLTIPASVTEIDTGAFWACSRLTRFYFQGGAPTPTLGNGVFNYVHPAAKIYYIVDPNAWGTTYGGLPTVPPINSIGTGNDLNGSEFGFTIDGTNNQMIVVEACTNLKEANWQPIQTNILKDVPFFNFTDYQWTNFPTRFYRIETMN